MIQNSDKVLLNYIQLLLLDYKNNQLVVFKKELNNTNNKKFKLKNNI